MKEKFYKEIKFMERAEKCEQIADEFAIGFYNWGCLNDHEYPEFETKQLLEIYKKENKL